MEADTISIHVPREGHDLTQDKIANLQAEFQSTCPARGTTVNRTVTLPAWIFQSTCPARGTTAEANAPALTYVISIHVPREGHDCDDLRKGGN